MQARSSKDLHLEWEAGQKRSISRHHFAASSDSEPSRFLGASRDGTIAFTAETGLRISEVLALRWADVDAEQGALVVRSTKTKTTREIGISQAAADVLRDHRTRATSSSLVGITALAPDALVFQTRTGRPQSRRNVLRAWQEALAEIGIEDAGLHTLRHSFISRLEERGVSVAITAELVGHSRITTTQAVYTRMRGGREAKLAAQREALRSASRHDPPPLGLRANIEMIARDGFRDGETPT